MERKGESTVLAITEGLEDLIEIGHQARPKTFALNIEKPALLYGDVVGVRERVAKDGIVTVSLDLDRTQKALVQAYQNGYRSIKLMLFFAMVFHYGCFVKTKKCCPLRMCVLSFDRHQNDKHQ